MGKYRIMLVDDEEEVRSAILKKLDWESLRRTARTRWKKWSISRRTSC